MGNFINPISNPNRDEKTFKGINNTIFTIQSDILESKDSRKQQEKHLYQLQQQQIQELQQHNFNKSATNKILMDIIKPIVTDIRKPINEDDEENNSQPDQQTIRIIANGHTDNHHEQMDKVHRSFPYDSNDRKVIMPLALKTTLIERERPIPTPVPPKSQSNIDDLKKHLLMLQNFTDNDRNFQSKFVVFKKSTTTIPPTTTSTTVTSTTVRTTTMPFPMTMYRTKPSINMPLQNSQILRDASFPFSRVERVTVVPQVFLQNDQEQPDTDDDRAIEERRKSRKNEKKPKKDRKRNKNNKEMNKNNNNNINNSRVQNMVPPPTTAVPSRQGMRREQRRRNFDGQKTPTRSEKMLNGSQVLIGGKTSTTSTPNAPYIINLNDKHIGVDTNENSRKLSRAIRSKVQPVRRRNFNKMQRDFNMPDMAINGNISKNALNDKIDLNPKHCYEVKGLSKGQQKICEQYTSIMPAISRGARAAIQVRNNI